MGSLASCLFYYILGGITFLPLVLLGILAHAYLNLPVHDAAFTSKDGRADLIRGGDNKEAIASAQRRHAEKEKPRDTHESDVAAGYFAVCREYVPGGVNGKPPERSTPAGSVSGPSASPSVYQSMYRSIFERKQHGTNPLDNKSLGKLTRRAGNIFYVVLRHGHLVLFDDDDQIEVRHVVSLHHHEVSIYSGEDHIPEGELFIKRNAICLSRRKVTSNADASISKPFYLFSDNCSEKEDFYFALLRSQEHDGATGSETPQPLHYAVKDIITLVQRLHSSEEHMQTRWLNALIGRIFLALYKTQEIEDFIRAKITKKISRVKTPAFLSKIVLKQVDMGEAAPVFTNPKLKDLTVDGELLVEADVRYSGSFRIEVATTARIDLGSRFKPREVNLLLAVVVKRLEGHGLLRIKSPPSNRAWVSFQTMPKIDLSIEPIVSSRQITYTLILRQIENRIKEVIAESLVLPNWDDSPFFQSEDQRWRGGIWVRDTPKHEQEAKTTAEDLEDIASLKHEDDLERESMPSGTEHEQSSGLDESAQHEHVAVEHTTSDSSVRSEDLQPCPVATSQDSMPITATLSEREKSMSMPALIAPTEGSRSRKGHKFDHGEDVTLPSSTESRPGTADKPKVMRKGSFASTPLTGMDSTNVDAVRNNLSKDADPSISAAMSALTHVNTPPEEHTSPLRDSKTKSRSSTTSDMSAPDETQSAIRSTQKSTSVPSTTQVSQLSAGLESLQNHGLASRAATASSSDSHTSPTSASNSSRSSIAEAKKLSLAAVSSAAANAKRWGWNALQKQRGAFSEGSSDTPPSKSTVMGRGMPLPPPGTPLPGPSRKTPTAPIPVPKRKPVQTSTTMQQARNDSSEAHPRTPRGSPLLSTRKSFTDYDSQDMEHETDSVFVVTAPADESASPQNDTTLQSRPWTTNRDRHDRSVDSAADLANATDESGSTQPSTSLLRRRGSHRLLSSSPIEDGPSLPTWLSAQEEEERSRQVLVDENMALS